MFIPNTTCDLYVRNAQADNFGKHTFQPKRTVKCSVVDINVIVAKSAVRADTSGSRGQADQTQGTARFLFPKSQTMNIGDILFKDGHWLEVVQFTPMRNVLGRLDHNQVDLRKREPVT